MLNWADLGSLLIILLNPVMGATFAADGRGSGLVVLAATGLGMLVGVLGAWSSSRLSYFVLERESGSFLPLLYMLTPILLLGASVLVTYELTSCMLSF